MYTVSKKRPPIFLYFSEKSANFYSVWCTHMVDTFNSLCNFAFVKFQFSCGITIGYLDPIFEGNNENLMTSIFHNV